MVLFPALQSSNYVSSTLKRPIMTYTKMNNKRILKIKPIFPPNLSHVFVQVRCALSLFALSVLGPTCDYVIMKLSHKRLLRVHAFVNGNSHIHWRLLLIESRSYRSFHFRAAQSLGVTHCVSFFLSVMHYSVLSKPIYSVTTTCLLRPTGCGTTDKGRKGNFASVWNAVSIWRLCAGFQGGEKRTNKTKLAASESLRTPCVRGSDWQQEPSQVG